MFMYKITIEKIENSPINEEKYPKKEDIYMQVVKDEDMDLDGIISAVNGFDVHVEVNGIEEKYEKR